MFPPIPPKAAEFIKENEARLVDLIAELTAIPAPSNQEERRAEVLLRMLHEMGGGDAYVDEALNVVLPMNVDAPGGCTLCLAHIDTVFPDLTPLPVVRDGDRLAGPGVGDDTANVAAMLLWCEYILKNGLTPKEGVIFAFNSGEEGLGNLKGVRRLMETYEGRIRKVWAFDGGYRSIVNHAVGSYRWQVTLKTQGGHSYRHFGRPNAIALLSEVVGALYRMEVPADGSRTTYNVGHFEGGTSVNTIAQSASMLFEYRSDRAGALAMMDRQFGEVIESFKARGVDIDCRLLGLRPCMGDVDQKELRRLEAGLCELIRRETGNEPRFEAASTDLNVPYALGVPGLCFGAYRGAGAHTREEYIEISSLPAGMRIMGAVILAEF
ncbi:MAG: M20/M25/M40 family metallo-hydrolase [Clostridia bacterium]|nr:M20/M25/M40 family metallo-hydrolase [Clostridia bacterium]